jgi:hypothetical protein
MFGLGGSIGAMIQLVGYTWGLLLAGALSHEPYYNPFTAEAWFLLAGLGLAAVLGSYGGVISAKNSSRGGRILFTGTLVGLVSYLPYYASNYQGLFSIYVLFLFYPPWWTMLFLAGGLIASQSMNSTQLDHLSISGKDS